MNIEFNIILACILIWSVVSWIHVIIDIKKNPIVRKQYDLNNSDIYELKDIIKNMNGREFEKLCAYIFKQTKQYKDVHLTPTTCDGGKDIILTTFDDEVIYVENKRYTDNATATESYMIGREICQKLIGSMVSDNVKHGIIMTTGNIHQNAWDYINKLEKNTNIKIDVLNMDDIIQMIREYCDNSIYNKITV